MQKWRRRVATRAGPAQRRTSSIWPRWLEAWPRHRSSGRFASFAADSS